MIVGLKKLFRKAGYTVLSLWLAFHVFAVFISPAAMPPASPLLEDGYRLALPYNEALFLNHGYHYFAPDPGASTLIGWEIPRDGEAPAVGRFPDVSIRPRLLYHRYFMLAENVWSFDDDDSAGNAESLRTALRGTFRFRSYFTESHQPPAIFNHAVTGWAEGWMTRRHFNGKCLEISIFLVIRMGRMLPSLGISEEARP